MVRVALDAMGSDHAPKTEVEGAVRALRELPDDFQLTLVGPAETVEKELSRHSDVPADRIQVVDAPEVIGMGEKPLDAIRKKRNSSIVVGLGLHKAAKVDGFISAGNTGALLAGSTIMLGLYPGVERATVGTVLPTIDGTVLLLDAGANIDCSARELEGFASLGAIYARDMFDRPVPNVGLLNVGEEEGKGNAVVREAHQLLKKATTFNYVGNVEGRDILGGHPRYGRLDVVVCDGFVGNVVLKFYESVLSLVRHLADRERLWDRPETQKAFAMLDYSQYGGALLLGVQGNAVICHGSSNANAIKHAIRVAIQSIKSKVTSHIGLEFTNSATTGAA